MKIEFDPRKNQSNFDKHGVYFESVYEFDFNTAILSVDDRYNYREHRKVALGLLNERVHMLVFTVRNDAIRVISFRKANRREVMKYERARPRQS